jgi:hypothetical protein
VETIRRGDQQILRRGIDDAHYFQGGQYRKSGVAVPDGAFSILLSHTPKYYRQAHMPGF